MMKVLIITFCVIFGILADDLPPYFQKCSLSDPELNSCIGKQANLVIPELVKGNKTLGIPVLSPLQLPEFKIQRKDFSLTLTNFVLNGFETFRISDVRFDLKNKKTANSARAPFINITSDYSITNSKVLTRSIHGNGKLQMKLVGNVIKLQTDVVPVLRNGDTYLGFRNYQFALTTDRGYYFFDSLLTSDAGEDINAFIDKHWEVLRDNTQPAIEKLLLKYFQIVIENVADNVPQKNLFLP